MLSIIPESFFEVRCAYQKDLQYLIFCLCFQMVLVRSAFFIIFTWTATTFVGNELFFDLEKYINFLFFIETMTHKLFI